MWLRNYRVPFWRGLLHALFVIFYCLFVSILILSFGKIFNGEVAVVIQVSFSMFLFVVSVAVLGYLIFFEPMKNILHHHFKEGSIMMASTLGWLLIFLTIFLVGLIYTL